MAESVAKPHGIVAGGEVGSIVGSSTFFAVERAQGDRMRDLQQALDFESLQQVRIEDPTFVLNAHLACSDLQRFHRRYSVMHGLLGAKNTEMLAHDFSEIVSDLPGPLWPRIAQQSIQSLFLYP
jgi:hypothetical protein